MRILPRLRGLWARLWCCFGSHSYGYAPELDACLCFGCGECAPLRVWRELYAFRVRARDDLA